MLRLGCLLALGAALATSTVAQAQGAAGAGSWTYTGSLATPRAGHTATLLPDGRVMVVGGATAEIYDPDSGTWSTTAPLREARVDHTATLLPDGKVLIAGGVGESLQVGAAVLRTAELYDPGQDTWRPTGDMGTPRFGHTAVMLSDGSVLVATGTASSTPTGDTGTASAERYDPVTGTWRATGSLAKARRSHTMTRLGDGSVLVVGGRSVATGISESSVEWYDPATGRWAPVAHMLQARHAHHAMLLRSGELFVIGGVDNPAPNYFQSLVSTELFDPATRQWRSGSSISGDAVGVAATQLASGDVLISGSSSFDPFRNSEIYDQARGTWRRIAVLNMDRYRPTATLLADGRVLVAGGYDAGEWDPIATNTAELFDPSAFLDADYTGTWFDPAQNGHGIVLEVLPGGRAHALWFTFNPAGDQQAWFGGVGTFSNGVATIGALLPTGGRWIPNFDPDDITLNALGTLTLRFSDRDHGRAEFDLGSGYGRGSMNLTRLTTASMTRTPVAPAPGVAVGAVGAVTVDAPGNVYFSSPPGLVYKLDTEGRLTNIAGTGVKGYSGDGGPASLAQLDIPMSDYPELRASPADYSALVGGLAVKANGEVYIADAYNNRVRRIDAQGLIATVVGDGTRGNADGSGIATQSQVHWPQGVAFDATGNLYVSTAYASLRRIAPDGRIATLTGTNCGTGFLGPGLCVPELIAVNRQGNVVVPDAYCRVREVRPDGSVVTIAGADRRPSGGLAFTCGYSGDGGPANDAALSNFPYGVAVGPDGGTYIADTHNHCIRKVDGAGTIRTAVGRCGNPGPAIEGAPLSEARFVRPHGVAVDAAGNLYVSDTGNHRVRKVWSTYGFVTTIAGNGEANAAPIPAAIGAGHSGSWYDPAQSGHGLMIEVLPDNTLFAAWFAHNPAGDQQAWFIGAGPYSGNRATIAAVQPSGGRWIPNFDASAVVMNDWGTLQFTFYDCNHARVEFDSVRGYDRGGMNLTRLTSTSGVTCP